MEHAPEPWVVKDGGLLGPRNKPSIAKVLSSGTFEGDQIAKADARRIVACVNACVGFETDHLEELEPGWIKEVYDNRPHIPA